MATHKQTKQPEIYITATKVCECVSKQYTQTKQTETYTTATRWVSKILRLKRDCLHRNVA